MRVGIAGLGHVGAATINLLRSNADLLRQRSQAIEIAAVSARSKDKKRECDLSGIDWCDDPMVLADRKDIDVIVEVMGGAEGMAIHLAHAALDHGKHLVTANKAMIVAHGVELAKKAEKKGLQLSFEASVCGGTPVLKLVREALAANHITSVRGILNGTCNYILSRMADDGVDYSAALAEAQKHGYAERNPADDVDGIDSANKLAILSALAFGTAPDISTVFIEGIRDISQIDLKNAFARGGRIKLLGIAEKTSAGIIQRVQPVFVPLQEPIARVNGVSNIIQISSDFEGDVFLQAIGAGGKATASAIASDLVDIARGNRSFAFGVPAETLS